MAESLRRHWTLSLDAPMRRDRRGGTYRPYLPDPLVGRPVTVSGRLDARVAHVERVIRELAGQPGAHGLEGLARFLLRSEAIASSRIEGLHVSARQVALAELAAAEGFPSRSFTANARLVANNITVVRRAAADLAKTPTVTTNGLVALHTALLPDDRHQGLRTVQNWIGGSDWHPIDAEFVPPPPDDVPRLMEDLAAYASGAAHAPLVQAAMVHAQFETIHPFVDGNGRVGRALIHTVLTRRGLTPEAVLPVSLVLLTRSERYVHGLTAYRYEKASDSATAIEGSSTWLETFIDAAEIAAERARQFAHDLVELHAAWEQRLATYRADKGARPVPRTTSAVARLLRRLPEAPALTARTAQRLLNVSFPAARNALDELAGAGILHRRQVDRGASGYLAPDVFELLTFAERGLASTRWDTREARPRRPVPARPQR